MIEGLTLLSNSGEYFWNDDIYYHQILPRIKNNLSEDELFIVSKWEDDLSKHNQKLYCSNIKTIKINYDSGLCLIKMSLVSYRLSFDIVFNNVSNFRFYQDDNTQMFDEIFSVYIIEKYNKEKWTISKKKRFYFSCPLFPVEMRNFHFIEYESLKINNLIIKKIYEDDTGIVSIV